MYAERDEWEEMFELFTGESLPLELKFGNHTTKQRLAVFQQRFFAPNPITGYLTILWNGQVILPEEDDGLPDLCQIYLNDLTHSLSTDEFRLKGPSRVPWRRTKPVECTLLLKLYRQYMPKDVRDQCLATHIRLENVINTFRSRQMYTMKFTQQSDFLHTYD